MQAFAFSFRQGLSSGTSFARWATSALKWVRCRWRGCRYPRSRRASDGCRLSPDRFAEKFGLNPAHRDYFQDAPYPSAKAERTIIPLMTGEEHLDVWPPGDNGKATVDDVIDARCCRYLFRCQKNRRREADILAPPGYFGDGVKRIIILKKLSMAFRARAKKVPPRDGGSWRAG